MWVRSTAIHRVSRYARVSPAAVTAVRDELMSTDARSTLDAAFERFEGQQPALATHVAQVLGRPLDEIAVALGYYLTLAIWLCFDRAHAGSLEQVSEDTLSTTAELVRLDEELRRADPLEALDTDDVIAMEQPALLELIHDQVESTLEEHADEIDVDDVNVVYRLILVEVLALSYAVTQPGGYPAGSSEILA